MAEQKRKEPEGVGQEVIEGGEVIFEPVIAAGNCIPQSNIPSVWTPRELLLSAEISIKHSFDLIISSLL